MTQLTAADRYLLDRERRATLVTLGASGRPRAVPVCYALVAERIVTPIDSKPKRSTDPLTLARVRDISADARVALLVDHWDEDWDRLAWLRVEGEACIVDPSAESLRALRARYAQYASMPLEQLPLIEITVRRVTRWSARAGQSDRSSSRAAPSPADPDRNRA